MILGGVLQGRFQQAERWSWDHKKRQPMHRAAFLRPKKELFGFAAGF